MLLELGIERYATHFNIELNVTSTVTEAKALFEKNIYDVALIDCDLPDGKGIDVVQFIRKRNVTLPIYLLSGLMTDSHRASVAQYSAIKCLEKNYSQHFIEEIYRGIKV